MRVASKIAPCLWFADQAEDAARFYVSIFKDARIVATTRYGEAGREIHGREPGSVLTVEFELEGQTFTALNGGPMFTFNEAVSLQIYCNDQAELDYYWENLCAGGEPKAQQCGWLKDKFGVSWQVVPTAWIEMVNSPDQAAVERAMTAMFGMKKIDMVELERAFAG
jgi:predicted 3-demethylubiquinone-9 3-methyltransferase (glyoxalase superfamily)